MSGNNGINSIFLIWTGLISTLSFIACFIFFSIVVTHPRYVFEILLLSIITAIITSAIAGSIIFIRQSKKELKLARRPIGVTVVATLYLISGAVSIITSINLVATNKIFHLILSFLYLFSYISVIVLRIVPQYIVSFEILVVASFIPAPIYFITGWGLWRLRPWARIVALVLAVIGILSIYGIPISVIIIWYLLQPEVKAAFQPIPLRPETRRTPATDKTLDVYLPTDALKRLDTVTPISNIEEVGKYAECPYCGSNIRETFYELGGIVRCDKCGAFHHKECFEYYGKKCGSSSCKLGND